MSNGPIQKGGDKVKEVNPLKQGLKQRRLSHNE